VRWRPCWRTSPPGSIPASNGHKSAAVDRVPGR
jgi:hypothetical protein